MSGSISYTGICLIVNNFSFPNHPLPGAGVNEDLLTGLFRDLGFEVMVKQNLSGPAIREAAEEVAAKDHSQYSAFVFCILSHGAKNDGIVGVGGPSISVWELMHLFYADSCQSLQGKPKLFFIEKCRGQGGSPCSSLEIPRSVCPQEADFLLAFATAPGGLRNRVTLH